MVKILNCEPRDQGVHYFDIEKIREDVARVNEQDGYGRKTITEKEQHDQEDERNAIGDKDLQLELMKRSFSFSENPYVLCRWQHFLQNIPAEPLIVKPYNFEKEKPKKIVRRKILKGQLYGKNFEFLPIPWFRDPRL